MSAATELDPIILKALGFFRSNTPDSSVKLKAMLNNAIHGSKSSESKGFLHSEKSITSSSKPIKLPGNDFKKRDIMSNKRHFDKVHDVDVFDQVKKPMLTTVSLSSSIKESSNNLINLPNGAFTKSSSLTTISPDDFALEMAGLVCAVCKKMTVGLGNNLVECQECHNLYHQDCHNPPVTDKDMNDPRRVWYCVKCKQKIKLENNNQQTAAPQTTANTVVDLSHEKPVKSKPKALVTPFKRSELKPSLSSSNSSTAAPMSGWAALSGKPGPLQGSKSIDDGDRLSEAKQENSSKKTSQKEKNKAPKNHSKNVLLGSDAWAEALGAKSSTNDKQKSTAKAPASNNNNTKHLSLSSVPWLSTPGSNISSKQKSSSIPANSVTAAKAAPFPKMSATTGSVTKSMTNHDSASKQVQIMKKRAASKIQQKRARI